MKIVVDNKIPFIRGVFEPYAEVLYLPGAKTTPEAVRDADALVTRTRTICDAALLDASSVKAIATATIGFDHIDTVWCESHGIAWSNAPGCNSWSVKQYITSVLCVLALEHGLDLSRLTLGVVGVGNVGSKVAAAGSALGMRVLLNDPPRQRREFPDPVSSCPPEHPTCSPVLPSCHPGRSEGSPFTDLDTLLTQSDIITLHVPLTKDGPDATWHLFDAARIARMRPSQILINSSRGPVVDNNALKEALLRGGLKAAVLDVWEGEPDLDPELVSLLDIATPHIAGYSADGKANGTAMSVRYIASRLGLPLNGWQPSGIPAPVPDPVIDIDARDRSAQEILSEAVLHAYDVRTDSNALKHNLAAFESLRGDYGVRREPSAFTVRLKGGSPDLETSLRALDFKVVSL